MSKEKKQLISSIAWNLLLITAGAVIFSIGVKAIVLPHGLITGGLAGISLICYYMTHLLTPGQWYFLINLPLFLIGWAMVSRRFFLYSLFGTVASSAAMDLIRFTFPIQDPFLAVLSGGAFTSLSEIPANTKESDAMSRNLKKRGFRFVGSTICYAFMQATGMVNDHETRCFRYDEINGMK